MAKEIDKTATFDLKQFANKKGVIQTNKLLDFLNLERPKNKSNSVRSPSALSRTPCAAGDGHKATLPDILSIYELIKSKNKLLACIVELQLLHGLRISEVLNIGSNDITAIGQVHIKGLKGSENRIVSVTDGKQYLIKSRMNGKAPFKGYSRYYVYREFKKHGLSYQFSDNFRNSVTHLFRHLNIKSLSSHGIDINTIKQHIGHKNIKSTKHYTNGAK